MQVIITKSYKLVSMSLMQIIFSSRHYHSQLITSTKNVVSRKPAFLKTIVNLFYLSVRIFYAVLGSISDEKIGSL